jgi:hypothetical protein
MSHIIDNILAEICLDERVKDGIFRLNEEEHMCALRDYFVKRGLTLEDAISITNAMQEAEGAGNFPDRQAWNADGILATFPTPEHKKKAIARGTHFEKNPKPRSPLAAKKGQEPSRPAPNLFHEPPKTDAPDAEPAVEPTEPSPQSVFQSGQQLAIEPPRGSETPESPPEPPESPVTIPTTPLRKAAEKAVVNQFIIKGEDDMLSTKFHPKITEEEKNQVKEIYEFSKRKRYTKVLEILDPYVN